MKRVRIGGKRERRQAGARCYRGGVRAARAQALAVLWLITSGCAAGYGSPAPVTAKAEPSAPKRAPLPAPEALPVTLLAANPEHDLFQLLDRVEPGNPAVMMMRLGWRTLLGGRLGDGLMAALDSNAPVMIGIGEGPAEHAPLVGVISLLPNARASIGESYELMDLGRGLTRLDRGLRAPGGSPIGRDVHCVLLTRAARDLLACALQQAWLPRYADFVADQLVASTRDATLRLQVRGRLLRSPDQMGSAELRSQAARAGYLTTLELLAAMRDFQADLQLVPGGFALSADSSLRPASDSLAALLVAPAPGTDRLPTAFTQLPADATLALTSRGAHPDAMREVAERFWAMLTAATAGDTAGRWGELFEWARKYTMRGGAMVVAYGHDTDAALAMLDAERASLRPQRARMDRALSDYWLVGLEEDAAVADALAGLLEMDGREAAARKAAGVPRGSSLRQDPVTPRDRMPKGTLLLQLQRAPTAAAGAAQRYVAMANQGGWLWLCASRDRALSLERLRGVLSGVQVAPQERLLLLRRPGVTDAMVFGYVTPAAILSLGLPRDDSDDAVEHAHAALREFSERAPESRTPVTLSYGYEEGGQGPHRARLSVFVPDGVLLSLPDRARPSMLPTP